MNRTLFGFTRQGSGRLRFVLPIFLRSGVGYDPITDRVVKGWWVKLVCLGGNGRFRVGDTLL